MLVQMPNEVLTVWCHLISITLSTSVMLTYLKLWKLRHAFIQFFEIAKELHH